MIEDKLSREQRIRLEALALANQIPGVSVTNRLDIADKFENFIWHGKKNDIPEEGQP